MNRTDLHELPPTWADKLKKNPEIRRQRKAIVLGPGTTPWGKARLAALAEEVSGAPAGTRNHKLNKSAFLVGQAVAAGHITEDDAHAALYDAAIAAGLTESETRKTLGSGLRSGSGHPSGPIIPIEQARAEDLPQPLDDGEQRPTHELVPGDVWAAIDAGSRWLASHQDVYSQQGRLVTVYTLETDATVHRTIAPSGTSMMADLTAPRAWDLISQIGNYTKVFKKGKNCVVSAVNPPMAIVVAILARHSWSGSRELAGISRAPLVHPDGSICGKRGYDAKTGMFFAKQGEVEMPSAPTQADAVAAVDVLLDAVVDFPWRSAEDRAGWVASLITVATRHLYPTVPLFILDASTPGSGKTLLTTVISMIALGSLPATAPYVRDDDEVRKMIFALLLSGVPMVVVDNAPGGATIGTPALDMLLTSPMQTDRVLRESRQATVPNNTTWYYTGNNVCIKSDTGRRTIHIRLETTEERPELRTGFRHPNIREWALAERPRLLGAALTIVSAYLRAGRPDVGVTQLGSFERWSEIVAGSLVWAGQPDPCDLLAAASADPDPQAVAHIAILEALSAYKEPMSARQMLDQCDNDAALKCAILELCPAKGDILPTTRRLGHHLRSIKDRIKSTSSGMRSLVAVSSRTKTLLYSVAEQSAGKKGCAGMSEVVSRARNHFSKIKNNVGTPDSPAKPFLPAEDIMQEVCQQEAMSGEKKQEYFPGMGPRGLDR